LASTVSASGALLLAGAGIIPAAVAGADMSAYLQGVLMKPGYNFSSARRALDYGYAVCDKVFQGVGYPQIVSDVKADFNTNDEFMGSFLIHQAVNELCPELIWQLRDSATGYRPPAGVT
jgi:hypothetical protein